MSVSGAVRRVERLAGPPGGRPTVAYDEASSYGAGTADSQEERGAYGLARRPGLAALVQ